MGEKIKSFTDLKAWQESHRLAVMVYLQTKKFPREELFGLINQLRRAAVSISSNIAEGFSRQSTKEKIQFYAIALGSLTEVQNQLLVSRDVKFLPTKEFGVLAEQTILTSKLVNGLIRKLRDFA